MNPIEGQGDGGRVRGEDEGRENTIEYNLVKILYILNVNIVCSVRSFTRNIKQIKNKIITILNNLCETFYSLVFPLRRRESESSMSFDLKLRLSDRISRGDEIERIYNTIRLGRYHQMDDLTRAECAFCAERR